MFRPYIFAIFVYYTYSRTQIYFTQQYSRYTTTCFSPICWSFSVCNLTYSATIHPTHLVQLLFKLNYNLNWLIYRAEACSRIPAELLVELLLCSTVYIIHNVFLLRATLCYLPVSTASYQRNVESLRTPL